MAEPNASSSCSAEGRRVLSRLGLEHDQLPRHVAIIMDGNGRWAQARGLPRVLGHRQGSQSVRATVEACAQLGLGQLTLYCFSKENWKRPQRELRFLMRLLRHYLIVERRELMRQNIRLLMIGDASELPEDVRDELDRTLEMTAGNTGLQLCLAINYGGRSEIVQAALRLAQEIQAGVVSPAQVDEERFASYLTTSGMTDPDLLIRTAGELRVSNFLLWQISYAELWVTQVLWPDFRAPELHEALLSYARRQRKYGGLPSSVGNASASTVSRPSGSPA